MDPLGTKKGTKWSLFLESTSLLEALDPLVTALGADRELLAAFAAA